MTVTISEHMYYFFVMMGIITAMIAWMSGLFWVMHQSIECDKPWWWPVAYGFTGLTAFIWFITGAANG